MSTWRERRKTIAEEYLQRANGEVDLAIQLLTAAIRDLPVPADGENMLDHLYARAWLKEHKEAKQ